MTANNNRAVIYTRFSERPDAATAQSGRDQLDHCREYCASHGLRVVGEFADNAVSGGIPLASRPGGAAALAVIRKGKGASHFVAYALDRLSRDVVDTVQTIREWDAQGVVVHLVANGGPMPIEKTPEEHMMVGVHGSFNEFQRHKTRALTKAAIKSLRDRGLRSGYTPPYGRQHVPIASADPNARVKYREVDHPEEQAIMADILGRYRAGESIRVIAAALNATGVPSRGRAWYPSTVGRIVQRHRTEADEIAHGLAS